MLLALATRRTTGGTPRMMSSASAGLPPLADADGNPVEPSFEGKRVGLYFTAGWCPMCTNFEPALAQYKKASDEAGKPIELVMVSSDRSAADAAKRAAALGMVMVPYEGDHRADIKRRHGVWSGSEVFQLGMKRRSGVPAIVVIDPQGDELAFVDAEASGANALSKWPLDEGAW